MTPRLTLPTAPESQTGAVKAWSQPVDILTYEPAEPDRNPMFLEKRVYQGSSGRVYPLPFTDRVATDPHSRAWQALHIENEFLRLMILPEIGGRIHVGLDKTNGYDFFYRQNVIKPALVGLAGPWISGGVEFNWPQHHRPATFLPVEWRIEESADGSRTIWCGDHDPLTRLAGAHGVCLYPDRAYVELKVRLYNRTPFTQTFLWWANVAVRVDEHYQSFFPPDVHFVADHAKRAISKFPLCGGQYYGVDYAERARHGVPPGERPRRFVPAGDYPANDLSRYANIPVPTSYMALGSEFDFSGGYDHGRQAGLVHIADHHIAPGKKQWTWGNHEFGYAWERNLTVDDGPYIELMAGVFTDNQPDFSFLTPGECKTFSQFWYPIQKIGVPQRATHEAALSVCCEGETVRLGVAATVHLPGARLQVKQQGETLAEWILDLTPAQPFLAEVQARRGCAGHDVELHLAAADGRSILDYRPCEANVASVPEPAAEPPAPAQTQTADELYLTGLHLDQYRHATRSPEGYWREALRRDPQDSRANHALGLWHLGRGEFAAAEERIRSAIERMTARNPNPRDGEPFYSLGLSLRYLGRHEEAYAAFFKAAWSFAWRSPAYFALAENDARRGDWARALEHLDESLSTNAGQANARNLKTMILRKLGRAREAAAELAGTLRLDPINAWARELAGEGPSDNQIRLDIAFDIARAGLWQEAYAVLGNCDEEARDGSAPMVLYLRGFLLEQLGRIAQAAAARSAAAATSRDYCFPARLEELLVLEAALAHNQEDASAHHYLGNWLYDRRRQEEAIAHWERSAELDSSHSVVWRNLGMAYFNVRHEVDRALDAFERAVAARPSDTRLLYERDQLWRRAAVPAARRREELERAAGLVLERDDLTVELAALRNQAGEPEKAAELFTGRRFQPWEGGEGVVLGEFARTQVALALKALAGGNGGEAQRLLGLALEPPESLGEAWHLLANRSRLYYWLGVACQTPDESGRAREWWRRAAESTGDFAGMRVQRYSAMTYYSALALRQLGREREARRLLHALWRYARGLRRSTPGIDYFATSLPAMLLFEEDGKRRLEIDGCFFEAQAALGLGYRKRARRLLARVLALDPSDAWAADLMAEDQIDAWLVERSAVRTC